MNTPNGGYLQLDLSSTRALEDMLNFKVVELLLELPYLLAVCRHAGVMTI
jgi:hypothetical protein